MSGPDDTTYSVTFTAEATMVVWVQASSWEEAEALVATMDPAVQWNDVRICDIPGDIDVLEVEA